MLVLTKMFHPSLLFSSALLFVLGGFASGQIDQGAIVGTVMDNTGAVVPGAKVTVSNRGTNLTLNATTGPDGSYVFSPIKIGSYDIAVEKQGFAKATQTDVAVNVGSEVKANFKLAPGAVTQSVEVTAAIPLLQTQTTSVGESVTSQQVTDLPLNGRNYTFLSQIVAGVTSNNSRVSGTGGFTANGLQWSHNSYILDGIDNNNDSMDFLNGAAYVALTPPDAIQEVKVQTSNFNAEYGRAGSAVLNATTKSGTNQLHGNLWEFFRNDTLDANSFLNNRNHLSKPTLRQNQFGFTVGGPVIHNKVFFFGDYQGTIIHQQAVRTATVPTSQERSSGFTNFQELIFNQSGTRTDALGRTFPNGTILDPATTRRVTANQVDPVTGLTATKAGFVRDPFLSSGSVAGITNYATPAMENLMNILPANRVDANAIKLLTAYPTPNVAPASFNNFGLNNNWQILRASPDTTHQFDIRLDENLSERNQLFERFSYQHRLKIPPPTFTGVIDNSGFGQGNFSDNAWNAALSSTHVFSPTMINEARIGYSRLIDNALPAVANVTGQAAQFGIQGAPTGPNLGGLPLINISGLTGVGPGEFASPNTRANNTIQLTENLTKIYNSHTFKGGFEGQLIRFAFDNPRDPRGRMDFNGTWTSIPAGGGVGSGIADLLLVPRNATVAGGINMMGGPAGNILADSNAYPDEIRHYYGLYFQDDWKATPNLTLNLGVRWEFFGQPRSRKGEAMMIPNGPGGPWKGSQYIISNNAKNIPLSPAFVSQLATDGIALRYSDVPGLLNTPKDDFAPRVGLAYQITHNLVARASYGIFYSGFENIGGSPDPGTNYPLAVEPNISDTSQGQSTLQSQYPTVIPAGTAVTLENALTFVTPNPTSAAFKPQGMSFEAFGLPWKTGSTQEWSGFVQYAITPKDSIQVGYVGNHSVHLLNGWRTNVISQILPKSVTNRKPFLPYPDFAESRDFIAPNGDAYYHGLQITYERRVSHGLNVLADYTRSVCKEDLRNILNDQANSFGANTGLGLQRAPGLPGFGLKGDYGYCGEDAPNVLHVASTWELPFGHGRRFGSQTSTFLNEVLGGWDVNGIFDWQDGFPGTVGCPVSTTNGFGCVANTVRGQPLYLHQGPHGIDHFLNPSAFSQPPLATTIGQTDYSPLGGPITQFHGPAYNNLDFSIFKQFYITERRYFELRSEFFNVLNHPNFGNPGGGGSSLDFTQNPSSPNYNFARITSGRGNARQSQLALKFYW